MFMGIFLLLFTSISFAAVSIQEDGIEKGVATTINILGGISQTNNGSTFAITDGIANVEVFDTGDTLTAAETGKICILGRSAYNQRVIFTLPAATAGLNFQFLTDTTSFLNVDPNGTDKIQYLTLSGGDKICSPGSATDDSLSLICGTAGFWTVANMQGTWTDTN